MIRVLLPTHLSRLAKTEREIELEIDGPVTTRAILEALETKYPMLQGTMRDHGTLQRRPFIRFFACGQDLSHDPPDAPLPAEVAAGTERFMVIGAMSGG